MSVDLWTLDEPLRRGYVNKVLAMVEILEVLADVLQLSFKRKGEYGTI